VWDTAGQEKNIGLLDGYYVGAVAGFFFIDVNSRETMSCIPQYLASLKNACGINHPQLIILAKKVICAKRSSI
jgi:GTPase SAR1 family protein